MHPVGHDHDGDLSRQISFPLATLTFAAFLWPLAQLHWVFICALGLIVSVLVGYLRTAKRSRSAVGRRD